MTDGVFRVENQVLEAARMVVTEGIGEGCPAHGFFIIVGDANEILADKRIDPKRRHIAHCKYGHFRNDLDVRRHDLKIGDCLGEGKRIFLHLFQGDGAVVVDGSSGQVCCGGFIVNDTASGTDSGGARTKAASAMGALANGCYVVLASNTICGSVEKPSPRGAVLKVFNRGKKSLDVPVRVSETVDMPSIKRWLRPLQFGAFLRRYNREFVEGTRKWVFDDLEVWRRDLCGSPCRVLLAGPGFGKTAIAARLHQLTPWILAIHLFHHKDSSGRDPRRMIASIAYQIADVLPQFRDALRKVRKAEGGATDAYALRSTARQLADCLLFQPLNEIEPPQPSDQEGRHMIIIDALDEAENDTKNDLLDLVAFDFRKLPQWVALLVTARPEVDISTKLVPLRPTVLDAEVFKNYCAFDVRVYLCSILAPRFKDEGSLNKAIDTIAIKSEGLFLYLHHIREMVKFGDNIDALPIGLAGVYQKELERVLGPAGLGDESSETRLVVEAIIAAQVPVHVNDELPGLSGVRRKVVHKLVKGLSRLLPVRDDKRVYIFHRSFVDWLTRDKDTFVHSGFIVDRRGAHRRLAAACGVPLMRLLSEEAVRFDSDAHAVAALEQLVEARGCVVDSPHQSQAFDEYALRWSAAHLVEAGGLENISLALLCSLQFLLKRAPRIDTLIADTALLLPMTSFLHRALVLAQNHVRSLGAQWLAEELWQRLSPAEVREISNLERLAHDSRIKARSDLMFSARHAHFPMADLPLQCVLEGHAGDVYGVAALECATGPLVASCSKDATVRIWDPSRGGEAVHVLQGHSLGVNDLTAFADATGHPWVASCSRDMTIRIWDPINGGGAVHVFTGHSDSVNGVAVFIDASGHTWVASCSDDATVRIWDAIKGGKAVHVLEGHSSYVKGVVAFVDHNGHVWVASCSFDRTVRIWDAINGGDAVQVLEGHSRSVTSVTTFVDADGFTWIASCSRDRTVRVWKPTKSEAVHVLEGHSNAVAGATAFTNAEGHVWLASCSRDKTVRIWDPIKGGVAVHVLEGHTDDVRGVMAFVDAKGLIWVASCSDDKTVRIWDPIKGGVAARVLEGHSSWVRGVTAFVDAKGHTWMASSSNDKTVCIWDPSKGGEAVRPREGHSSWVKSVTAFVDAAGCPWVASCSGDKTVRIWDPIKGGEAVHMLAGHSKLVSGVTAFVDSKGNTWVASCSWDKMVRIWDPINGGEAVHVLYGHSDWVNGLTAFVDAKGYPWVASCSNDKTVCIWDPINGGEAEHVLKGHSSRVNDVTAFMGANGHTFVVSCSGDDTVRVWDTTTGGEAVNILKGHSDEVVGVMAFVDAEGHQWVASCSHDKTVRIWDPIKGGEAVHVLEGHSDGVEGVTAFVDANDDPWVASWSMFDTTVRIWDPIQGGEAVHVLEGHSDVVNGVTAFVDPMRHPRVASRSNDKTVRIWDPIKGGAASFVIPLESRAVAISTLSTSSSRGVAQMCLVIGQEDGRLSYWDQSLQFGDNDHTGKSVDQNMEDQVGDNDHTGKSVDQQIVDQVGDYDHIGKSVDRTMGDQVGDNNHTGKSVDQKSGDREVANYVLEAARMVVTEGLGEGRPAHGFFIIVGNANEILAHERIDPKTDIAHCKYGHFPKYLDLRRHDLKIGDCLGERKRIFLNLFHDDGAVVVDGKSGQLCCGGFIVKDLTSGIGSRGARTKAASAMARQAGGCYVVLASTDICGSVDKPIPPNAVLTDFDREREPRNVPVQVSETVSELSFEKWLHPLNFSAYLGRYNREFVVGTRQWVFDDLEAWRRDPCGSPCRVLLAGPGFGKTAIAARLFELTPRMLAIHLCRHNDSSGRDPRRMISSIAYQIADVLPQFRDALHKVRNAEGGANDSYALRQTARELADCILFQPLMKIEPPKTLGQDGRHMIMIDALDEAEHGTKNDLLDLVAFDFRKLPRWVALLVTARADVDISRKLAPLRPTVLDAEVFKSRCDFDVRLYLRSILAPRFKDEGSLSKAIDTIAIRSEGLFLYLHYVCEMVEFGDNIDALPIGLAGVYQRELERVLGPAGLGNEYSATRWVVEAIISAQVPVHVSDELPGLSGVPSDVVLELVHGLSRLLPVCDDDRVYAFHKSFVDWLTRDKHTFVHSGFIVDPCAAHCRLASACGVPLMRLLSKEETIFESDAHAVGLLKQFVETRGRVVENKQSRAFDEYALQWSVTHFVAAGLQHVGLALLCSLWFLLKRAPQMNTLIADAALMLPTTELLYRTLLLAQSHVRLHGAQWLAEELWQRLLYPAETRDLIDLVRLARDARVQARAELMFSCRRSYFTPADSALRCVFQGHNKLVKGVTALMGAEGHTWVATCPGESTVRIWDPNAGSEEVHVLEGHSGVVNGVTAFVVAGDYIWVASCSDDTTVRIWDPIKGGEAVHVLEGHSGNVNCVTSFVDANGYPRVASCADDATVRIWDPIKGGEAVRVLRGHSNIVVGVTAFVDTKGGDPWVASWSADATVRIWNPVKGGNAVRMLEGHSGWVNGVTTFVDAKGNTWMASCSNDNTVRIWDPIHGGMALHVFDGHTARVNGVTTFSDAQGHPWVVSCSRDKTVRIWDPTTGGEAVQVLEGHAGWVNGVTSFVDAMDQTWVASCSEDATVRIWDPINGGEAVHVLQGHSIGVRGLTVFKDAMEQTWLASYSSETIVCIWDHIKSCDSIRATEGHSCVVRGVTVVDAKGYTFVASCSNDKTVRIWDPIEGGEAIHVLDGHSSVVRGVTSFVDSQAHPWVASCSTDQTLRIWDPVTGGGTVNVLKGHSASVNGVTNFVDANGRAHLASCSDDKTVRIWDPVTGGKAVHVLKGHSASVNSVTSFAAANGRARLASCSDDKTVHIWDPISGVTVHVLKGHSSWVEDVTAFVDATGHAWVASCSEDLTVRIWDPISGDKAVHVLEGHSGCVCGVTAFADAKGHAWVASCSRDNTVRIWDPINGGVASFAIPLESPPTAVSTVSDAPSRRAAQVSLIIGHADGHISYWDHPLQCRDNDLNGHHQDIGPSSPKRIRYTR